MKITSPTPQTDKAIVELDMQDLSIGHKLRETQNIARELERELTEAHAAHGKTLMMCEQTINKLRDENEKLKAAAAMPNASGSAAGDQDRPIAN